MTKIIKVSPAEAKKAFLEWRQRFEARSDARIVVEKMRQKFAHLNQDMFPAFQSRVLAACFNAHVLKTSPDTDDFETWRTQIANLRNQQEQLQKALKIVREALEASPLVLSAAIASGRAEPHIMPPLKGHRLEYAEKLAEALTALGNGIPVQLADDRIRQSSLNRIAGCLEYPKAIHLNCSKPDSAINGLAFELALRFKQWSISQEPDIKGIYEWHGEGNSSYSLIADFVNVALDIPDCGFTSRKAMDRISDLISNHPGIRYCGWTNDVLASGNGV